MKNGREVRHGGLCHRFYSIYTANTLPRKLLKVLETSKDEGT
jgi:hypothetical protein